MKIGIPRSFYFYYYPSLFETFFKALGYEVVISQKTTKKILDLASTLSETENCLPQKIFDGHVLSIKDSVDAIFIPRIISMEKGHICCPRFGALPDACKAGVAEGIKVISFDINETRLPLEKNLVKFAKKLGFSAKESKAAALAGMVSWKKAEAEIVLKEHVKSDVKKFLILGHPYTLYDSFIADPIVKKLKSMNVPVEMMTFEEHNIKPGEILWCTFNKMNSRLKNLDMNKYAGVIQITTFNCGTDSMMTERFRRESRHSKIPYMLLMIDEHTGKAGIDTRLEAFVDSLSWNKNI